MICASCGAENPGGFRFCGACGAELVAAVEQHESRKTVTLLFCDVVGSTSLGERLDPETLRRVMSRYFEEISDVVEMHGGTIEKFVGDAVMAVFGVPRVREDDALRAVRAAAEIQRRLPTVAADLGVTLSWRTGINTGEVVVGQGQTFATGDAVNVAARLEQAAEPGQVLLGADTYRLVHSAVRAEAIPPLSLKGKAEGVPAYRLLDVPGDAPQPAPDVMSVFVGRDRELALLDQGFERVGEGACHLFTLLGSAGVGKSRLVARFLERIGDRATVVRGRCLSYGDAITFFPMVDVLGQLGPDAADALSLISEGGAAAPNELFFAVRRALERRARERPLVVVIDDLHWAEPMLLDLLDHIADLSRGASLLLLCVARPELLDVRPSWAGGKLNATTVLLEPLRPAECRELLDAVADSLDPATRAHVATASEGNPLFAVEMVALALEGGDVRTSPTITAILAARLDQLAEDERAVIQRGAVEGKVFHSGAVRALTPQMDGLRVDQQLSSLVRKDLVRPERAEVGMDDDAYRFRHVLVRDAAYDALPKRLRAELHEQFAGWLEGNAIGLVELAELVGWHLEQAVRYRRELGVDVDPALLVRAGERLAEAADHARARADSRAADKLYTRAIELLPVDSARRLSALRAVTTILFQTGELDRADVLVRQLEEAGETPGSVAARLLWLTAAAPEQVTPYVEKHAEPMLERARGSDDHAGLAALHVALFNVHWFAANAEPAWMELRLAMEHAQLAGDTALYRQIQMESCGPLAFGPTPAEEMQRLADEWAASGAGPLVEAGVLLLRGELAIMRGDLTDAETQTVAARARLRELGMNVLAATMAAQEAEVALADDRPDEAIRVLEEADAELAAVGERGYRSTVVAELAAALYRAGRIDEAERRAAEAVELSAPDDVVNFIITDALRAQILADRGDLATAEELARSSLAQADRTDFPLQRARSRATLARVLSMTGRVEDARGLLREAIELFDHKGDRFRADLMREALGALPGGGP